MATPKEPPNVLYKLLLLVSAAFVVTALAYTYELVQETRQIDAGSPSPFRNLVRAHGWIFLLYELAAMMVLGLASMALDRWRRWRREHP